MLETCKRACVCIPFLTVLAHTHSSAVARGRVAAGALADLEANAAAGAAGRPGSPGSPRSISMETHRATSIQATLATDGEVMLEEHNNRNSTN